MTCELKFPRRSLALSHRGAWGQVIVAAFLITVLPALILAWGWKAYGEGVLLSSVAVWGIGAALVILPVLGYAILLKYPISIVRLRQYLSTLASGGIPDQVVLTKDEDDLAAVHEYLNHVVAMAEDRIRMLETRQAVELESERQRVMVESIGAMCHHLGQPAAVMGMCLYRLKKVSDPRELPVILDECELAVDSMRQILDQLRALSRYSSEPYLASPSVTPGTPEKADDRIISI